MSLQPIDLQTLFTRLQEVGREQGGAKELPLHAQSVQAEEMVKKANQESHSVKQTSKAGEGPEKIKDEKSNQQQKEEREKKKEHEKGKQDSAAVMIVKDSDLGNNIDILG
ncbi:hypothetical protein WKV44_08795 [Spirochaetia bacterium 38H-sp]|uniref:Uncharacterized protein n=1 Tax=Rarispira pelagica TaxID=3141764 RepID=A0ABU9UD91_9SPIR